MAKTTEPHDLKGGDLFPMSLTSAECFLRTRQKRYLKNYVTVTGQRQKFAHAIDQSSSCVVAGLTGHVQS